MSAGVRMPNTSMEIEENTGASCRAASLGVILITVLGATAQAARTPHGLLGLSHLFGNLAGTPRAWVPVHCSTWLVSSQCNTQ